jgi:hypothetical protein
MIGKPKVRVLLFFATGTRHSMLIYFIWLLLEGFCQFGSVPLKSHFKSADPDRVNFGDEYEMDRDSSFTDRFVVAPIS